MAFHFVSTKILKILKQLLGYNHNEQCKEAWFKGFFMNEYDTTIHRILQK